MSCTERTRFDSAAAWLPDARIGEPRWVGELGSEPESEDTEEQSSVPSSDDAVDDDLPLVPTL